MESKLRLVFIEPNSSGGLIHYAYQLCTALAEEGLVVTLVTGKDYELAHLPHNFEVHNVLDLWTLFDPQVAQNLQASRWQRRLYKMRRMGRRVERAVRLISAWTQLTRYVSRLQPDIVQFSKINFPFEAFFLARLRRRGLTLTQICHEFELREQGSGPFSVLALRAYADIYRNFSAIFFHARENREKFRGLFPFVPAERTHIIPHGNSGWMLKYFDQAPDLGPLRERYKVSPDQPVVLFFGLLSPSKGLEDLIDAFALVRKSCDVRLILAGYPTKHFRLDELHERIAQLHLQEHVVFDLRYIPLEDVGGLMRLATVAVYPYRSSTQSGALQVAYTFSRPVVATNVGGLPEAVEHGRSGFLAPPNSPSALAEQILKIVANPRLGSAMGEYARQLSETRFSWQVVAEQIVNVYRQLPAKNEGLVSPHEGEGSQVP